MKAFKLILFIVLTVVSFFPLTTQAENKFIDDLENFVEDLLDGVHRRKGHTFNVNRQDWICSTDFVLTRDEEPISTIVKTPFHLDFRAHYDLYDEEGRFVAYGIRNILNTSFLSVSLTEIEIYRPGDWFSFGYIDGQWGTFQAARFSIYENGVVVAIAFLDRTSGTFTFVDPETETRTLATFKRHFILDEVDNWTVHVSEHCHIAPEIIKIFAAFVIDKQDAFKEDR